MLAGKKFERKKLKITNWRKETISSGSELLVQPPPSRKSVTNLLPQDAS